MGIRVFLDLFIMTALWYNKGGYMGNNCKKRNIIPLKELNLTNRFLFDEVMEDAETQRNVLSIIFDREIPLLERTD